MRPALELPRIVSTWATGAEFCAQLGEDGSERTFYHPVRDASELPAEATPGAILSVSLRFLDRDVEFHVHGRVLERNAGGMVGLRLAFLAEERDRQELVLASAEGERIPYLRRKAVRTPCDLEVQVTSEDGSRSPARLTNISERGAYVGLVAFVPGRKLELAISFPGHRERVHVAGRITAALSGPQRGAGVEFMFVSAKQRDAIAAAVVEFRAALERR